MEWIPIAAWIAAAVLAIVVIGFAGFEVLSKTRRLQRDIARLESVRGAVDELRSDLDVTQQRIAAARIG